METRQAEYLTSTVPNVLLFSYPVASGDTDEDGIAVPANGIRLAGGTIVDAQGGAAGLGHAALAADAAHKVDGSGTPALTGGVCEPHARGARSAGGACQRERHDGDELRPGRPRRGQAGGDVRPHERYGQARLRLHGARGRPA